MIKDFRHSLCVAFLSVCAAGFFWGCETGGSGLESLTVSPSSATISGTTNAAVVFTVGGSTNLTDDSGLRPLSLPLEWRVSNPALGYISGSAGTSATYVRSTANGVNTIYVEDQYGAVGNAVVNQQ